ncbi:response regulator [Spirosoma gilvum]
MTNRDVQAIERLILIVDDNRDAARLLARMLELKGYSIYVCYDGPSGLQAAQQLRPWAVLLDLAMPDMDGFAVCRAIREEPWGKELLVIAQSGYSSAADLQRSQEAGFDRHLTKPVDFVALLSLLEQRLA